MAATAASLDAGYHVVECRDVQVLKGIVFSDRTAGECLIEVTELERSEQSGVTVTAKTSSQNLQGKPVYHYSGTVKLAKGVRGSDVLPAPDLLAAQPLEGATFYESGTLFHGALFRSVKQQLNISQNRLTLRCVAPICYDSEQGQFPARETSPWADDALLQAVLIQARHLQRSGSLPLKIRQARFYGTVPASSEFLVTLEVISSSSTQLIARVCSHDAARNIFTRFEGAEASISEALNEKFVQKT